jgi:hypothetical protein
VACIDDARLPWDTAIGDGGGSSSEDQGEASLLDDFIFDDTNGRYPEDVKARAPHGTRARIRKAAECEGLSTREIIRRALLAYLDSPAGLRGSHEAWA